MASHGVQGAARRIAVLPGAFLARADAARAGSAEVHFDWSGAAQSTNDPLRREKELLTNWLRRRQAGR